MTSGDLVLAVIGSGGKGVRLFPFHLHVALFLVDAEVGGRLGGPKLRFQPTGNGPYATGIERDLEQLEQAGDLVIRAVDESYLLGLTEQGYACARGLLSEVRRSLCDYVEQVVEWVVSRRPDVVLYSISRRYPHSVDGQPPVPVGRRRRRYPTGISAFLDGAARTLDLAGTLGDADPRGAEPLSDGDSLYSDWVAVGDHLRGATARFARGAR